MPPPSKSILKDGLLSFYVQINGPQTFRIIKMAVDTGATYTIMPPEIAFAVGYNPTLSRKHIEITTASGVVIAPVIKVKSVACLGREVRNLEVICHGLPPQSPVRGLLGINFLIHFPPFQKFLHELTRLNNLS